METLAPVWQVLVFVVLPLWVLAGFGDYLCHRATDIEHASGTKESVLHWVMLGEAGVPMLVAVFFEVNALVMAFMIVCLVAHEVTTYIDLKLAMATRKVTAVEQQIHSLLEILPFTAMLLVFILHWGQAQALFGFGDEAADLSLTLKPLPSLVEMGLPAIAFFLFAILPYGEEFVRGLRVEAREAKLHKAASNT